MSQGAAGAIMLPAERTPDSKDTLLFQPGDRLVVIAQQVAQDLPGMLAEQRCRLPDFAWRDIHFNGNTG